MAIYYVSPTGSDGAAGSIGAPWLTVGHADGVVGPGDTVLIATSTYNEALNLTHGGTAGNPVTYLAATRYGAALVNPSSVAFGINIAAPYITFDGLDMSSPSFPGSVEFQTASGGSIVRRCKVHNIGKGSVHTGGAINGVDGVSGTITVDGCVIYDIGTAGFGNNMHGFYMQANLGAYGQGKITNNLIYSVASGSGVQLWGNPQGWDVVNNTIFTCSDNGVVMGPTTGNTLANNRIENNIFVACLGVSSPVRSLTGGGTFGTGNVIQNNLDYLCAAGYVGIDASIALSNNISSTNPLFVNYQADGSGDYHLQVSSPCIDAGSLTIALATDFDGNGRPQGAGVDIGAYEYGDYTHKFSMFMGHL